MHPFLNPLCTQCIAFQPHHQFLRDPSHILRAVVVDINRIENCKWEYRMTPVSQVGPKIHAVKCRISILSFIRELVPVYLVRPNAYSIAFWIALKPFPFWGTPKLNSCISWVLCQSRKWKLLSGWLHLFTWFTLRFCETFLGSTKSWGGERGI